jgi:hypothetical protein
MEQIQRAGINSDLNERRDKALFYLKNTGEYKINKPKQLPNNSKRT